MWTRKPMHMRRFPLSTGDRASVFPGGARYLAGISPSYMSADALIVTERGGITGLGFWMHQFRGFGYFYPLSEKATAVMFGLTYELNGKIKDSDATPGGRLSLEWGVSQYLSERLEVGVQGGHNWQVADDSGDGVYWDAGVHYRKSTVGFSAGFWTVPDWLYLSGRYLFDFGLRQRFKNDCWAVNVIFLTNVLTGGGPE